MRHCDTFGCHWCVCKAQCEGQVNSNKMVECKSCRITNEDYANVLFGDEDIPPIRVSVFAYRSQCIRFMSQYIRLRVSVNLSVSMEILWLDSFAGVIGVMVQGRWNFRSRFSLDVLCQWTGPDRLWS